MVAMTQRLDASGLFFCTQLSVSSFLALVLKVFRNRFRCHGQSVAELSRSKLSTFGHLVTMHRPPRRGGMLGGLCQPNVNDLTPLSLVRPVPLGSAPSRNFFRTGVQVRNCPSQSRFAIAYPTWSRTRRQRQHVGQVT
jgi:hypothetical protein